MVVCVSVMPRSAIMMTKSLKLNLKLVYQLTHRRMICPSKWRPLNNASTGTNRCILSSSPDHDRFAPEPSDLRSDCRWSSNPPQQKPPQDEETYCARATRAKDESSNLVFSYSPMVVLLV